MARENNLRTKEVDAPSTTTTTTTLAIRSLVSSLMRTRAVFRLSTLIRYFGYAEGLSVEGKQDEHSRCCWLKLSY